MLQRIYDKFGGGVEWLRAGYPAEAPRNWHSVLLALNGPLALTPDQKCRVAAELDGSPADITTVEVAITKATGRLPTPSQTREAAQLLPQRPIRH